MSTGKRRIIINGCAFLCMVVVNILAETLPIGGATTGEISAVYPSPLTPAPYAFSIWGAIYVFLMVFLVMGFFSDDMREASEQLGLLFVLSCAANIGLILTWHFRLMTFSLLMMAVLLLILAMIEARLRPLNHTARERWLIRAPFGLYYGWITAAAIANVSVWLMSLGFTGFGLPSVLWQTLVLLIGGFILSMGIRINRDSFYGIAAFWAYIGIMVRQLTDQVTAISGIFPLLAIIISCAAFAFFIVMSYLFPENRLPASIRCCSTVHK